MSLTDRLRYGALLFPLIGACDRAPQDSSPPERAFTYNEIKGSRASLLTDDEPQAPTTVPVTQPSEGIAQLEDIYFYTNWNDKNKNNLYDQGELEHIAYEFSDKQPLYASALLSGAKGHLVQFALYHQDGSVVTGSRTELITEDPYLHTVKLTGLELEPGSTYTAKWYLDRNEIPSASENKVTIVSE